MNKTQAIHSTTKNGRGYVDIPVDINSLYASKDTWVILKLKGPKGMIDWLDKNKKINKITYNKFITKLFIDYHKLKPILEKILANQDLTPEDILTIHQSLQMEKVL